MDEKGDANDARDERGAGLKSGGEKGTEEKWEAWGRNMEARVDDFARKLPAPVSAFFDALCASLFIAGAAWVLERLDWVGNVLSWGRVGALFCALLAVSLVYRLLISPRHKRH